MRRVLIACFIVVVSCGCSTSTYNMPEQERSRTYAGQSKADVFEAAVSAVSDIKFAVVEADPEKGQITARKGMTMKSWKGFALRIVVIDLGEKIRVEANAEELSGQATDWGSSKKYVRQLLQALDTRMR